MLPSLLIVDLAALEGSVRLSMVRAIAISRSFAFSHHGLAGLSGMMTAMTMPQNTVTLPKDEKHDFPSRHVDGHAADCPRRDATNDTSTGVSCKPETMAQRLLATRVEHGSENRKSGRDGGFGNAEKESSDHESSKILGGSVAHDNGGPKNPERPSAPVRTRRGLPIWKTYTVTARYFPMGNLTIKYTETGDQTRYPK
jgi:hypothetical protein